MEEQFSACTLCPRNCQKDRNIGQYGYCGMDSEICLARAALHMWEEPCISGRKGSGAVFFSGCNLRCVYCQNHEIAIGSCGKKITKERLKEIFLELQAKGAANLNLVTAVHYVPQVIQAIQQARKEGFRLPVVYNSSGYEKPQTLRMLEGYVDIYLPDFKYMEEGLAKNFSHAEDYPEIAKAAIEEMVRQSGPCVFDEEGYLVKGTIVRHLILPGHTKNAEKVLQYLHETYGDSIYVSIMNQYTPVVPNQKYPELNRKVTKREYKKVLEFMMNLGIQNGFFQEGETAEESFIPAFDLEGV